MSSRKLLTLLRPRGGKSWIEKNALLYDTFTTDDAAPITSPRTCEPGPGVATIVDTTNKLTISGGALVFSEGNTAGNPGIWIGEDDGGTPSVIDFTPGDAFFFDLTNNEASGTIRFGGDVTAVGAPGGTYYQLASTSANVVNSGDNGVGVFTQANGARAVYLMVPRATILADSNIAGFYAVAGGKLCFMTSGEGYAEGRMATISSDSKAASVHAMGVLPLATYNPAWGGDWSEVTDTKTNPASSTTFDCAADFHLNATVTIEDTKFVRFIQRYQSNTKIGAELTVLDDRRVAIRSRDTTFTTYATSAALTDGVSYEFDFVVSGTSAMLYIDKVLTLNATLDGTEQTTTGGIVNHDLATNDIVITTHPYPALGIADSRVVCPQDNAAGTHSADCVIEFKNITLPTDNSDYIFLRLGDYSNNIRFDFRSDGGLILYDEVSDDVDVQISAGAGTVSNGDDVVLVLDGANGEIFVNGTSSGTTSGIRRLTGTGFFAFDFSGGFACDHIACFPRDVSSLLPKGCF
jgi:hypothetical protein